MRKDRNDGPAAKKLREIIARLKDADGHYSLDDVLKAGMEEVSAADMSAQKLAWLRSILDNIDRHDIEVGSGLQRDLFTGEIAGSLPLGKHERVEAARAMFEDVRRYVTIHTVNRQQVDAKNDLVVNTFLKLSPYLARDGVALPRAWELYDADHPEEQAAD